ncbi:MAG: shikimate kinase [Pseudomonadota bacterium]|nr:shikimate kinase [Pseudomonadota bacterium]
MDFDTASSSSAVPGAGTYADRDVVAALLRRLDRPLVLVGMMGVGKTSLGRRLGALLGVPFVDADEEIEAAAQMTIPEIFATYDEAYFRAGERRVIARLIGDSGAGTQTAGSHLKVIATGGGAFCHAETRELILRHGIAIWLDAELDTLVERTARKSNRPLLENGNRREILAGLKAERASLYAQAPIHVQSGNGPHQRVLGQVCNAILSWLDAQPSPELTPDPTEKS